MWVNPFCWFVIKNNNAFLFKKIFLIRKKFEGYRYYVVCIYDMMSIEIYRVHDIYSLRSLHAMIKVQTHVCGAREQVPTVLCRGYAKPLSLLLQL